MLAAASSFFRWGPKIQTRVNLEGESPEKLQRYSLDTLIQEVRRKNPSFTIEDHIQGLPKLNISPLASREIINLGTPSVLFRFFATLFNTFATAFNFFDESDNPPSIYEKQVLIQIYYRFFQIPYMLALVVQPLILVAWKTYLIVMAVLAGASAIIYIYLKLLYPFPDMKFLCEDIDFLMAREFPHGLIQGLDREADALIQSLNRPSRFSHMDPVMILGETGNGKTTLFFKLHQMIKAGTVPASLKKKKVVLIYGGKLMAGNTTSSFADKIKHIEKKLAGYQNVIICIDEIHAVAAQSDCFERLKEFMRRPDFQFIAATTKEGFKTICEADRDYSFRRPLNYIRMEKWESAEVHALLKEKILLEAPDAYITAEAVEKIIELTDAHQKEAAQPAKAVHLLESVLSAWRTHYGLEEPNLKNEKAALRNIQANNFNAFPFGAPPQLEEQRLTIEIERAEAAHREKADKAARFHDLLNEQAICKKEMLKVGAELAAAHGAKKQLAEKLQKQYLSLLIRMGYLAKQVESQSLELEQKGVSIKIDGKFVEKVFQERKEIENSINH